MENQAIKQCEILSIEAWRVSGGWTWNSWHCRGMIPLQTLCAMDKPNGKPDARKLLSYLRDEHSLWIPVGECEVVDDGYNYVIQYRGTQEPIYAVEYGIHY